MDHGPFNAVELLQQIGVARLRRVEHPARHVFQRRGADRRVGGVRFVRRALAAQPRDRRREESDRAGGRRRGQGQPLQDADRCDRTRRHLGRARGLVLQGARRAKRRHRGRGRAGHQHRIGRWSEGRRQESRRAGGHRAGRHPLSVWRHELRGRTCSATSRRSTLAAARVRPI